MVFVAGLTVPVHADEARLLRFPSTNGTDVVFTYAGDLYRAPLSGGEAQRLTSHVGYEIFLIILQTVNRLLLQDSMMVIQRFI